MVIDNFMKFIFCFYVYFFIEVFVIFCFINFCERYNKCIGVIISKGKVREVIC